MKTSIDALARWTDLRGTARPDPLELSTLWDDLPTLHTQEVLGLWRGFAFTTGHRIEQQLVATRWFGKHFVSAELARPLVCRTPTGELFSDTTSGRGEASLWNVEFRGQVSASMVYDGMPVVDHFKQVDPDTLMGVMNGNPRLVLDQGQHFWFGLERDHATSVDQLGAQRGRPAAE